MRSSQKWVLFVVLRVLVVRHHSHNTCISGLFFREGRHFNMHVHCSASLTCMNSQDVTLKVEDASPVHVARSFIPVDKNDLASVRLASSAKRPLNSQGLSFVMLDFTQA